MATTTVTVNVAESQNYLATSATISVDSQTQPTVISSLPTQNNTLVFDDGIKYPTFSGAENTTIGGDTYGYDAGVYIAEFTPKPGCQWWDGTTSAKKQTWTIQQPVSERLQISPFEVTVSETSRTSATISLRNILDSPTYVSLAYFGGNAVEWSIANATGYDTYKYKIEAETTATVTVYTITAPSVEYSRCSIYYAGTQNIPTSGSNSRRVRMLINTPD